MNNLIKAITHDENEIFIKEFFSPLDYFYQSGSFDNDETCLKDLLRHQITNMMKGKNVWGYNINIKTSYDQVIPIGYIETKLTIHNKKSVLDLSRFYIFKLYRKLRYTKDAFINTLKMLFDKYETTNQMNIKYFENNKSLSTLLIDLGFRLSKLFLNPHSYRKHWTLRSKRRSSINVHCQK